MRYRLERDLGYKSTLDFQVTNPGGSEIFNMIFATDNKSPGPFGTKKFVIPNVPWSHRPNLPSRHRPPRLPAGRSLKPGRASS
jgi:hypothetical protein